MDARRSSRLRLADSDSGKQRLSRFIRRNLDLIESTVCIKKSNSFKGSSLSRTLKNPNETTNNSARAVSSSRKAGSRQSLNSSSSSTNKPDLAKGNSKSKNGTRDRSKAREKANSNKGKSSSCEPPISAPSPKTSDLANRALRTRKADPSNKKSDCKRKPDSSEAMKTTILSTNTADLTKRTLKRQKNMARSKERANSPKTADSPKRPTKSSSSKIRNDTAKNATASSRNNKTSSPDGSTDSDVSISPMRNIIPSRTSFVANSSENSHVNVVSPTRSNSNALNSKCSHLVVYGNPNSTTTASGDQCFDESNRIELNRIDDSNSSNGSPKKSNSVISISDSDSSDGRADGSSHEYDARVPPNRSYSGSVDARKLDSSEVKLSASVSKLHGSPKRDSALSDDLLNLFLRGANASQGNVASSETPKTRNSPGKHQSDSDSRKPPSKDSAVEEDLGLETLKRTMVELFAGEDSITTLPFIHRKWPEKSCSQPKKLPSPKKREKTDDEPTTDFISLIDYSHNTYFVQCQLSEVDRETMNHVARRLRWSRDYELTHDTKFVIVKEESFHEEFDGIPENILKANASGGAVLLFDYVQECAVEDKLVKIRKHHIPKHKGTWRKMFGRYNLIPTFADFAFFITPEITDSGRHERDVALLRNLLQLTRSKLCSSLDELRKSSAPHKVALRSTAISDSNDVTYVHYHWLYECVEDYRVHPLESFACDFTVY